MANKTIELTGDKRLQNQLKELPKRVAKKGLKKAADAGIKPIAKAAKAKAPKDTGMLKKAIGKKVKSYKNAAVAVTGARADLSGFAKRAEARGDARGVINATRKVPAKYLHLVQYGTRPHKVGNRYHSGAKAQPFLRNAQREQRNNAISAVQTTLDQFLKDEIAKTK